jgi:hypothetical protein
MAMRKSSTRKRTSTRRRSTSKRAAAARAAAATSPRPSAAQLRQAAKEEARWRAEGDLRTLRQAEEIRRDNRRLQMAARIAAEEMKALQAIRTIRAQKR